MLLSLEQIKAIMPNAKKRASVFLSALNDAMKEFSIDSEKRIEHFLAQIGHESGELLYVRELASGAAYEGRKDLGNTEKGDGRRFRGRGLIQITGRANYLACSLALFGDDRLIQFPELLEDPVYACRSACWFWSRAKLNSWADKDDARRITRIINGGYNGLIHRLELLERARKVIV